VVNKHRELIYEERRKVLSGESLRDNILEMVTEELRGIIDARFSGQVGYEVDYQSMLAELGAILPLPAGINAESVTAIKPQEIAAALAEQAANLYDAREKEVGADNMRMLEKLVMLRIIDSLWVEHLTELERMRVEAGWASLRQVRPIDAYKREGFRRFEELRATIRHDVARTIFHVTIQKKEGGAPAPTPVAMASGRAGKEPPPQKVHAGGKKIGRNDPCPCGSGKKYKHCCGR
jgi:preprotein translocase subunit SecA